MKEIAVDYPTIEQLIVAVAASLAAFVFTVAAVTTYTSRRLEQTC